MAAVRIDITIGDLRLALLIAGFTILSGMGDAQGFIGASRMWNGRDVVWFEASRSAVGFAVGAFGFMLAVRFLREVGVSNTEVQTLFWFAVTLVAVALLSRTFGDWARIDKAVAVAVMAGIGWLLFRVGE